MTTTTLIQTTPLQTTPLPTTAGDDAPELVLPSVISKGWHADPMAIHKLRWHDGEEWTEHVTHFGPVPCQQCGR